MLHRMALRVLPSLSLAVTEDAVRKQKRIVMFVPGVVAFGIYRLAKQLLPLTEPTVLLTVSGMVGLSPPCWPIGLAGGLPGARSFAKTARSC